MPRWGLLLLVIVGAGSARPAEPAASTAPLLGEGNGHVFCSGSSDAYSLDLATLGVGPRILMFPDSGHPHDAEINPAATEVWAVSADADRVLVIDRATDTVTRRIPVGRYPVGIAFSWDGAGRLQRLARLQPAAAPHRDQPSRSRGGERVRPGERSFV